MLWVPPRAVSPLLEPCPSLRPTDALPLSVPTAPRLELSSSSHLVLNYLSRASLPLSKLSLLFFLLFFPPVTCLRLLLLLLLFDTCLPLCLSGVSLFLFFDLLCSNFDVGQWFS